MLSIEKVVDSGWFISGDRLREFEKNFAEYIGAEFAIGVGSGLDALKISMLAAGIGPGDEVIIPSHTFFATAAAVVQTGATPVFSDVNESDLTLQISHIKNLISPKTKAIIPVHLYGIPVDMNAVRATVNGRNITIIEDFAQSAGALYNGQKTGSLGNINATSFYPVKTPGALGDGGMIMTGEPDLAEFCYAYRNYGSREKYLFRQTGVNSRLDEIQAAILTVQLKHLDRWLGEKRDIAGRYRKNLSDIREVKLPDIRKSDEPAWHIFPILAERRDDLQRHLRKKGIETLIHYPIPPYRQPALQHLHLSPEQFPVAEMASQRELSLPIYPGLKNDQIDYISDCILGFFN